jgi:hypothetical protein
MNRLTAQCRMEFSDLLYVQLKYGLFGAGLYLPGLHLPCLFTRVHREQFLLSAVPLDIFFWHTKTLQSTAKTLNRNGNEFLETL